MQSRSAFSHNDLLMERLVYRSKFCDRKMQFLKEGAKAAVKAIDSSVKNQWFWKWSYELTELSFGKVGPIKYQLRVCMKKIDVPGTAWCMWCEEKIS